MIAPLRLPHPSASRYWQANAYEALFRAFSGEPWWGGVFWWLWRADATAGGTGDSDFTPHGKPAEGACMRVSPPPPLPPQLPAPTVLKWPCVAAPLQSF